MRSSRLALWVPLFAVMAGGSLLHETPVASQGVLTAGLAGSLVPLGARGVEPAPPTESAAAAAVLAAIDPTALRTRELERIDATAVHDDTTTSVDAAADELAVVRWSIEERSSIDDVAGNWGMWATDLRELNPDLGTRKWIEAGTSLVVHRADPHKPTRSVGRPQRGHLVAGIPLPEGDAWQIRTHRPRVFGSRTTIASLLTAMRRYAAEDPDAPPVRLGEISRRNGGRSNPHVSHRSGRDVDIGYVLRPSVRETQHWWRTATPKSIDAKRTWDLIAALIETGEVQQIYVSAKLQRLIAQEAAKELPPERVAQIFSAANTDPRQSTIVRHEHGHRDHFHVRFGCEDGNIRCRRQ